jgi:uncharacterized membrane protein YidH (DUF202 family)
MVAVTASPRTQTAFRPTFYFWITVALAFVIFGGFGLSYFQPMASGNLRPMSPVVHLHGLFYFAWMLLLMLQSGLVNSGNVALHRRLGTLGISLATGLVIFASVISVVNIAASLELGPDPFLFQLMYLNLVAIVSFTILFSMAMNNTRRSDYHRRYILIATIAFIGAGINRFYVFAFEVNFAPFWFLYLVSDLFIAAILLHDWKVLGKVHPASLTGAALVIGIQLLHWPVAGSAAFESVTYWLAGLAGYSIVAPV